MKATPNLLGIQRGVAAVETALLLIPLLILALGIAEGGRAVYQYNTIAKSTRDAVRYLTTVAAGPGPNGGEYYQNARCLAVYGNLSCSGPALVHGLDPLTNVQICDRTNWADCDAPHDSVPSTGNGGPATGALNLVTVKVSGYVFESLIPFPFPQIQLDPIATTMRQAL